MNDFILFELIISFAIGTTASVLFKKIYLNSPKIKDKTLEREIFILSKESAINLRKEFIKRIPYQIKLNLKKEYSTTLLTIKQDISNEKYSFQQIEKVIANLFNNNYDDITKIYDKNYNGNITIFYDNSKTPKIIFKKNDGIIHMIKSFYKNGELMYYYTIGKRNTTLLMEYSLNGELINENFFTFDDSHILDNAYNNPIIIYLLDIILFHVMLESDNINELIDNNNISPIIKTNRKYTIYENLSNDSDSHTQDFRSAISFLVITIFFSIIFWIILRLELLIKS
ncbi:hypothetical protein [Fusobacterium sp. PH5-44]|uniref:hypothetical protein n=1 Tax=unclassified Fusobacterium TaxID=2648384 RepID=UPI003D1FBED4